MNRKESIERLRKEDFDVCIIGAGASGAGCALDAASRGLRVALVDRGDFAAETSSRSTKLIHGGVRYLEQAFKNLDFAQLRQVRHGLEERYLVLKNAPHLASPLGLITPVFSWFEGFYFSLGLRLYGWFASSKDTLPQSRWLSKAEALTRMPGLSRKVHSAVLYYDGQLDDARYCLALAQSAAASGAAVANHVEVTDFGRDSTGKLATTRVRDRLSGTAFEVRAKVFLNCTGPYSDAIRLLADPAAPKRMKPSKGVHAIVPLSTLGGKDAMLIPKTSDGRVVFAVPFEGELMVGTTDEPYTTLDQEPTLNASEVHFLLETLNRFADEPVRPEQVKSGFGGLRPLITAGNPQKSTKTLLRDHEVEVDEQSGLMSLLGGKWTTYRLMAQDAVDALCRRLGVTAPCKTKEHVLVGGVGFSGKTTDDLREHYGLNAAQAAHLASKYGTHAEDVARLAQQDPDLGQLLHPNFPYLKAEVVYAARAEMACTPRDFLARRVRMEISDWKATQAVVPTVARILAIELGWNEATERQHVAEYVAQLERFRGL
jgi:glycerol-3-phosphate dehydrogenase